MADSEPTKKLTDAVTCIASAAKLHLELGQHSSETCVSKALQWRYGISSWEADRCYEQALRLLDAMPRKR